MVDMEKIETILSRAILAPSVDNCQPWRLSPADNAIEIFLDKPRAEFFGDYGFTASYATIGALVENMVIAATNQQLFAKVAAFPVPDTDEPVARVTFAPADVAEDGLSAVIGQRCTNRKPYRQDQIPEKVLQGLHQVVGPGARLVVVENPESIRELSHLAGAVDRIIFEHQLLHENLFHWMRWEQRDVLATRDGMGIDVLELPPADRLAFKAIASWPLLSFLNLFGISRVIAGKNSGLLRKAGALGLLVIKGSTREDYFHGGRYLERLWLQATMDGLAMQPYGGMPFLLTRMKLAGGNGFSCRHLEALSRVKGELTKLIDLQGDDTLLMLFRIGYADQPSARTLRRPLSEILTPVSLH